MKSTGIIKHIDTLGRFKIPKELLTSYDIKPRTNLHIYKKGKNIILNNFKHSCIFCFSTQNIHTFKGQKICETCINKIRKVTLPHATHFVRANLENLTLLLRKKSTIFPEQ